MHRVALNQSGRFDYSASTTSLYTGERGDSMNTLTKTERLQVRISGGYLRVIKELRHDLDASSNAEVIKVALTTLKWAVDQTLSGRKIVSVPLSREEEGELIPNERELYFGPLSVLQSDNGTTNKRNHPKVGKAPTATIDRS